MNPKILLISILFGLTSVATADSGAVVCKEEGIITTAVQFDIRDLQRSFNLITSSSEEKDLARQRVAAISDKSSFFRNEVLNQLEIVFKNRKIRPYKIRNVDDSKHVFEVSACENGEASFEQAAVYEDDKLTYSSLIWEKMDNISQASLNVYEAIYKVLRDQYGEETSERTAKIVAYLFAQQPKPHFRAEIPTDIYNHLKSKSFDIRYGELLDYFLEAEEARFSDINKAYDKCLSLHSLSSRYPYNLTPNFKMDKLYNKKGKFSGVTGNISFEEVKDDIIFGRVGLWGRNSTGLGLGYFAEKKKDISDPVVGLIYTDIAGISNSSELYSEYFEMEGRYLIRKTEIGDLIIVKSNRFDHCEEISSSPFKICNKIKNYNIIKEYPTFKPEMIYLCPLKSE